MTGAGVVWSLHETYHFEQDVMQVAKCDCDILWLVKVFRRQLRLIVGCVAGRKEALCKLAIGRSICRVDVPSVQAPSWRAGPGVRRCMKWRIVIAGKHEYRAVWPSISTCILWSSAVQLNITSSNVYFGHISDRCAVYLYVCCWR